MYGPVNTWFWPYLDGVSLSNFSAYSFGTGAETGSASAPATIAARGRESLKTTVRSSGVWMPEISFALPAWNCFTPSMSLM